MGVQRFSIGDGPGRQSQVDGMESTLRGRYSVDNSTVGHNASMTKKKSSMPWKRTLEPSQYAMAGAGCAVLMWLVLLPLLLLLITYRYTFIVIDDTREWYGVNGCAEWAKAVVAYEFNSALAAHATVHRSARMGIYRTAEDLDTVEHMLAPIFQGTAMLQSVDLAFANANFTLRATWDGDVGGRLLLQSSADDCASLGPDACFDDTGYRTWYTFGEALPLTTSEEAAQGNGTGDGAFGWPGTPELLTENSTDGMKAPESEDGEPVALPALRLVFRSSFLPAGEASPLFMGRVTFELGRLSGGRLKDDRLGDDGRVYVCDSSGTLLAARDPKSLVFTDISSGAMRLKHIWELGDSGEAPVPSSVLRQMVQKAFSNGYAADPVTSFTDGTLVVVSLLSPPLENFAVVVVVPSWEPFANTTILWLSLVSAFIAPLPYAFALAALIFLFGHHCRNFLTKGRHVYPDAAADLNRIKWIDESAMVRQAEEEEAAARERHRRGSRA